MKTPKFFIAMLFMAAALAFAACEKEDNNTNNNSNTPGTQDPEPDPEPAVLVLAGTTWETSFTNSYSYMGMVDMNIDAYMSMEFNSATEGEMFTDITMEVPAMPDMGTTMDTTEAFTYTFDGTTLTMTSTGADSEEGDMGTMTYNPQDTTFYMMIPDVTQQGMNLRDLYGSDRVIFHKVRK